MKYLYSVLLITTLISCNNETSQTPNKKLEVKKTAAVAEIIDSLNGVYVYYNGGMHNVSGRNTTKDGYNLGLKYQCVEFVKRYYYEHYNHKMPNSWGHAKDFYRQGLADGQKNIDRDLIQYSNPSADKPAVGDLVIYGGSSFNSYGHVAIISAVNENEVEVTQQNVGRNTRATYYLTKTGSKWKIDNNSILGWLRKE